jgi:hypothetical protein
MLRFVLALACLLLSFPVPCFCQVRTPTGAAAIDAIDRYTTDNAEARRASEKALATGKAIFGADPRWATSGRFAGPLGQNSWTDISAGDWGCTSQVFEAMNKVSPTECLARPRRRGAEPVLFRGLDTAKVTDGAAFIIQHPLVVSGTFAYQAVSGASKTVLVLERNEEKLADAAGLYRKWSDASGGFSVLAMFVEQEGALVRLRRKDSEAVIEVPTSRLSRDDLKWLAAERKRAKGDGRAGR